MKRYELSKQKNIRDLGGLPTVDGRHIKYGRLYRGGVLAKVNEDDIKVIDSFHLTDIVDFRGHDEFTYVHDYPFKGVTFHNFPAINQTVKQEDRHNDDGNLLWFIQEGNSGINHLKEVYRDFASNEKAIDAFRNFFKVILEDNKVTYFHCSQGKDRAGFAAYLIEIALGVPEEYAFDDYMLTNIAMDMRIASLINSVKDKPFYNKQYEQDMYDVFSAKMEYLQEVINTVNQKYGSTMNFITDVLHVDVERLKTLYLE